MTGSSFVTSDDLQYFAKQLSEGHLLSSIELQNYAGQVAWSVKDASQGKSFFPPIPRQNLDHGIEVDFDGENNKVLATRQPSQDETPPDEDVVVVIPQTLPEPEQPHRPILRKSPASSPAASPKRSKVFWRKSKTAAVAAC